jgi:hypothetical protein
VIADRLRMAVACYSVICNYITKSPKHLDDGHINQEIDMTTQICTKLAALSMALMLNGLMIGVIAYLFSAEFQSPHPVAALAQSAVAQMTAATI